jgi:hypothetical protein
LCASDSALPEIRGRVRTALRALPWLTLAVCVAGPADGGERSHGLPLEGVEAEEFLRVARVVDREEVGEGITKPERLTLTDGDHTTHAIWKNVDEHKVGQQRMESGGWEFDFRDSWKAEVAAYELDKLLGLGLVPPTVERRLGNRVGSLQLWVEGAMTADERETRNIEPPTPRDRIFFNWKIYKVRFLHLSLVEERIEEKGRGAVLY